MAEVPTNNPRTANDLGHARTVLVVGAGVSGCACAAVLATRGLKVVLVNSALDQAALPGYGPELVAEGGVREIGEVFGTLPRELREVWVMAAMGPDGGGSFAVVDRRKVSIEAKRALETLPGLEFRQGLVCNVRTVPVTVGRGGCRTGEAVGVAVETVFGETLEADALVVAVGLSLGGVVTAGDDSLAGGRYGETPAEALRGALEEAGARFRPAHVSVGPRFLRSSFGVVGLEEMGEMVGLPRREGDRRRTVEARALQDIGKTGEAGWGMFASAWPEEYPPAPHWSDQLRSAEVLVEDVADGRVAPALVPDGCATGEMYVSVEETASGEGKRPRSAGVGDVSTVIASRLAHEVSAVAVENLGPGGHLEVGGLLGLPIWVTGRAGGSTGYVESLAAGVRTGDEVARALVREAGLGGDALLGVGPGGAGGERG